MTDEKKTSYAGFWLYKRRESWHEIEDVDWERAKAETEAALAEPGEGVTVRGTYSLIGLNANADLMVWCVTLDLETLQDYAVKLARTPLGRHLDMAYNYFGLGGLSLYDPTHSPAFVQGKDAKKFLSVYPFIKTHDWYLLPFEERRRLMKEHGEMGRDYPSISTNTVNSFGLQDQEFIVALEDDDPETMLKMVQALRSAEVRKYTTLDTPIFLGHLKPAGEALEDLR
jgi:chlorite dismutase